VSPTVLVIEDDKPLLALLGMALEGWGHRVLPAAGAEDAVRAAEAEPRIDLMLVDVGVVEKTDRDLVSLLRTSHPESRRVFMSGFRPPQAEPDEPFLMKPFALETLEEVMRDALDS
jgi:DNA-binding NtrC family response regulator